MEFRMCTRCGGFFSSKENVCSNCLTSENFEKNKLKTYIAENNINNIISLNDISVNTGISSKNLNRFLNSEEFDKITLE